MITRHPSACSFYNSCHFFFSTLSSYSVNTECSQLQLRYFRQNKISTYTAHLKDVHLSKDEVMQILNLSLSPLLSCLHPTNEPYMRKDKGTDEKKGCVNKVGQDVKVGFSTYTWLQLGVKCLSAHTCAQLPIRVLCPWNLPGKNTQVGYISYSTSARESRLSHLCIIIRKMILRS